MMGSSRWSFALKVNFTESGPVCVTLAMGLNSTL